jgi:formimidoylglutamate deiminase
MYIQLFLQGLCVKNYLLTKALLPTGWANNVRIVVDDSGYIVNIEPDSGSEINSDSEQISGFVIPSMTNLHSHAFQRVMAGFTEVAGDPQDSFWTWREQMYRMVGLLTPDQVEAIATYLYIDMLKAGYTQVGEFHYLHHDLQGKPYLDDAMSHALINAATNVGIGQTMLPVLYRYSGFGAQSANPGQKRFIQSVEQYLTQLDNLKTRVKLEPLLNYGLCFHSLRAVGEEDIKQVLAATDKTLPIHIHIAEQQQEVNDCLNWSGERPVEWLINHIGLDQRWCLVHATHMTQEEVKAVAQHGATVGICPSTEANLGDGIFDADAYIRQAGSWGIGSDSHVSLSTVEELRWLEYGQRLRDQKRNRLVTDEQKSVADLLWQQAALGGAKACGVKLGELIVGNRADWLVINDRAWFAGCKDQQLLNRWIFGGKAEQISDVYVAGQCVISQGQHILDSLSQQRFTEVMQQL